MPCEPVGSTFRRSRALGPGGRITLADVTRAAPSASNAKPVTGTQVVKTRHGGIRVRIWEPTQAQATSTSIVLIHGLFADIEAWASLALNLSRSGQRVVALDLPGHGQSDARVDHFDQIVESAADVLSHAAGKRQVIVGHSFGALVAARLARSNVSATQALVLIAPMGLGTEIAHPFLKGVMHAGNNEAMARELAKLNHAGTKPSDSYMDELRSRIESRRELLTRMVGAVDREGVQQVCISESLQSLACPITVLHGRADVIIPWQHALNAPSRAALHLIPDVGHMPQWEAATLTTEAILRAVRSTPTQA